ncbi:MAG TPA: chromosome segregation protein SMC [Elusimicrobia bacterium]|nr:chromosome segregation protein SMC [Elusimicrobiota bacterium]HBT60651.1 chromosome segregation protein SMC [Elusimicrobiota bacterium]
MYLKSIDIVGYKSFAVKTHLDFGPGITGIVGPNGCGKSNIMECVRWCLGEMSWKSLRADSMIEVIFSGTEKRPPLSMTEVTLTFDNSSSQLPTQFSEVTVTRRIYRSGESAYFLNRTQCRLRDIRDMFLDTGVGGDGYAIIDQGGVDFVLRAKPEERRALFEEAAGVAKYKAKREEALRKLERVEADMARLMDSVSLIDEQVKKLDSEARKAKLYKKYQEELVGLEAAKTLGEITACETQLADLAAKAGPVQERLDSKRAAVGGEEAEVARLELERASAQAQFGEVGAKIAGVKAEIGKLDERCRASAEAIAVVDQRFAQCSDELAAARERLLGMDPQIAQAGAEVDRVRLALEAAQQELAGWQGQADACAAAQGEAQRELEARRGEALAAAEAALAASREVSSRESDLGREFAHVSAVLRGLQKDMESEERSRREYETLKSEADGHSARTSEAQARVAAAQSELAGLRDKQKAISDCILRVHSDLSGSKARAESLEAQGGQNPYWVGAQAVLNAGIEGVVGSVRSLIQVEESWRPYVEDLLGERLFAVVCEHSAAARAGVEFLQAAGAGRARFLVLSTLPPAAGERSYPEEAKPLLRHMQYDPRHENAVRFLFSECYALDKVLFGDHWVCGGAQPGAGVQLSLSDLEDLRASVRALESQSAEQAAASALCLEELAAAESKLHEALGALSAQTTREQSLRQQLLEKEEAWSLGRQNVQMGTEFATGIIRQGSLIKEELQSLRARQLEAQAREKACRQTEAEASAKAQCAKDAWVEKRSSQQVFQARIEGLDREMSIHANSYERLAESKKHLENIVAQRGAELEDLSRRRQEAVAVQDQSRQHIQCQQAELSGQENAAAAAGERLLGLDKALGERRESLLGLKADFEAAQQEFHDLEMRTRDHQTRQDMLRTQLWDQWQLTLEEAKAKHGAVTLDLEKLETLRKRLSNMGPINQAAPEEYEALAQRQSFLNAQISDLTQAKDDLKAAIQKINATTREHFRQTFTDTREHFRRLYGVLFEGGEADLVMTDPDNILDTGIDIVAQPPGKRLQSISLLSGGEKTMTAIALLFAFFMVRPSPFCMLDEADAALDDANVERFVSMLKEFGSRTQFLIISHNKRTMEAADVIYGVTMEEKGVSQIVSIEFQKRAGTHAPTNAQSRVEPQPAAVELSAVSAVTSPAEEKAGEVGLPLSLVSEIADARGTDAGGGFEAPPQRVDPAAAADESPAQG